MYGPALDVCHVFVASMFSLVLPLQLCSSSWVLHRFYMLLTNTSLLLCHAEMTLRSPLRLAILDLADTFTCTLSAPLPMCHLEASNLIFLHTLDHLV